MGQPLGSEADHLRTKARKDLLNLLEGVRGKKNLVISKALTGPINLFINFSTLKEYGVDKLFVLENGNTDSSQRNIAYIVQGESASQVQATAEQIKRLQKNGSVEHEISIFWVPRRTLVSNKILEDEGVLGDANIFELPLLFLPLEEDVLSLEWEDAFPEIYLRKDPTAIFLASKALMIVQQRHGFFPRILGKGDNARKLANLLVRGRKELDVEDNLGYSGATSILPSATIDSLIVIDRDVDFATLLLTQLTYEGLIEETVGIHHNQAEVDSSITGNTPQTSHQQPQSSSTNSTVPPSTTRQSLKSKIRLDSSDTLYSQLRSSNFAIVGSQLNKVARRLEADYEVRHSARTTTELGDFVKKLPAYQQEHQSLRIHTNLAEEITKHTRSETFSRVLEVQQNITAGTDTTYQHETIEELIARDVSLPTILRLLCLESCLSGGIRPRDLDNVKRQILHAYGYQHLLTLDALEKMELLQPRSSANALLLPIPGTGGSGTGGTKPSGQSTSGTKTNYNYLRKVLRLIMDEVNEQSPNDIAYVYSGYAPLSIRILQCILQKSYLQSLSRSPYPLTPTSTGWHGFEDILKSVKGPTFSITQKAADERLVKARDSLRGSGSGSVVGSSTAAAAGGGVWKTIYIMFLGGITFTEIAALRFVGGQLEGERKRLMICTTGIVSGNKVMEGVMEKKGFGGS